MNSVRKISTENTGITMNNNDKGYGLMKSLLDIQQEIRTLENSVQQIMGSIKNINADIDNIRNSSEVGVLDFCRIEILAKQFTFSKHPLDKLEDGRACQVYLEMLLNIVRLDSDGEVTVNRMVFIKWLQLQSRIDWSLEDLYKDSFKIEKQSYYELVESIPKKYREYFIVDALIVANIAGSANEEIYEYISDMIAILGMSSEDIKKLALISRLALSQNVEGISREQLKIVQDKIKGYGHYIKSNIVEDGIKALRVIAVELHDSDARDFKWKVKQHQKVRSGDVIAAYKKEKRSRGFTYSKEYKVEEIKATVSGTIFQFRDNNTNYGVIAHEQDDKDSIKAWVKARR